MTLLFAKIRMIIVLIGQLTTSADSILTTCWCSVKSPAIHVTIQVSLVLTRIVRIYEQLYKRAADVITFWEHKIIGATSKNKFKVRDYQCNALQYFMFSINNRRGTI